MIRPSVKFRFSGGSECKEPVVEGCSVEPYALVDRYPEVDGSLRQFRRDRCTTHGQTGHVRQMHLGIEIGVVEQADQEERGTSSQSDAVIGHRLEHHARLPHVDEVEGTGREQRAQHRRQPRDVGDGRGGQVRGRNHAWRRAPILSQERRPGALVGEERPMRVDHPLGRCGGTRRVADDGRTVRVDPRRAIERISEVEHLVTTTTPLSLAAARDRPAPAR